MKFKVKHVVLRGIHRIEAAHNVGDDELHEFDPNDAPLSSASTLSANDPIGWHHNCIEFAAVTTGKLLKFSYSSKNLVALR